MDTQNEKIKEATVDKMDKAETSIKEKPFDILKAIDATKELIPNITNMFKPEKKDPSTMCEFTIKGSDNFVIGSLRLIFNE